jgi:hypothetical protein
MTAKLMVRDLETGAPIEIDIQNNTRTMRDPGTGKLVTMDLGQADVHIDAPLANYAAGYTNWGGIADEVAPVIPVAKASDKFYTWDKDDVFQYVENAVVAPGGHVNEVNPRLSSASYSTVAYGLGAFVPTEVSANADAPLQPEMAATRRILNALMLNREVRVANLVTTSGNWSGGYTAAVAAKWNGGTNSNPVADLFTAIESSLTPVRAVAMSERVWHSFVQNAAVQKYIFAKSGAPSLPNTTDIPTLFGLPPFLIGKMKGKTSTGYGYVWGNNVALITNDPTAPRDGQTISTAYTFRWNGANTADGNLQGGFLVRSYFDPKRGPRGGRMIVAVHNDVEVLTSIYAGGLITGAYA